MKISSGFRLWPLLLVAAAIAVAEPGASPPRVAHAAAAAVTAATPAATPAAAPAAPQAKPDAMRSAAAFRRVAEVLRHPRCMNCHPRGDFPRVGDERRRHDMGVVRGKDDHGVVAMRCSTCHSDQNVDEVPGAPHWGLAPLSMAWEGLSDAELADQLKDPQRNGGKTLEQIFEHMAHDKLVLWAWSPGAGRQPPPIGQQEFVRLVREWIDHGAVSPGPAAKR